MLLAVAKCRVVSRLSYLQYQSEADCLSALGDDIRVAALRWVGVISLTYLLHRIGSVMSLLGKCTGPFEEDV